MVEVTALRPQPGGRVLVELDDRPWRVLPADVCVRAGVRTGCTLDRASLRVLRRELRRADALGAATRALSRRDLSRHELAMRLERRGVVPAVRDEVLGVLGRAGYVDDVRFARSTSRALCARNAGDAEIRARLDRSGIDTDLITAAIAELPPEVERARAIAADRGGGRRALAYLARRGFGDDAIEAAADGVLAEETRASYHCPAEPDISPA